MRRKDREVTDFYKMLDIMQRCDCCRIGFAEEKGTYILPMNFGYLADDGNITIYFHCASQGKKLDLLRHQPFVGFEMDTNHELIDGREACDFSFRYQSIIGRGQINAVSDYEEKLIGLRTIMSHYCHRADWTFDKKEMDSVTVLKLVVTEWSCKEH